jgi:hypothetical protein
MEDRRLWQREGARPGTRIECVMVSCCAGAELQLRRTTDGGEPEIVLRELYPTKSDLYERSRTLRAEYGARCDS